MSSSGRTIAEWYWPVENATSIAETDANSAITPKSRGSYRRVRAGLAAIVITCPIVVAPISAPARLAKLPGWRSEAMEALNVIGVSLFTWGRLVGVGRV